MLGPEVLAIALPTSTLTQLFMDFLPLFRNLQPTAPVVPQGLLQGPGGAVVGTAMERQQQQALVVLIITHNNTSPPLALALAGVRFPLVLRACPHALPRAPPVSYTHLTLPTIA